MSQLSAIVEQQLYESIRNNNIKTTQNAVRTAYNFISKLPNNTVLDIMGSDPRFVETYNHMINIISYNLSIKLVEFSDSDIIKNLTNNGYLIDTSKVVECEPVEAVKSEPVKCEHVEAVKPKHVDAVKPIDAVKSEHVEAAVLCKTVKPNITVSRKPISWLDEDEEDIFEREQLLEVEKEKMLFEQYKADIIKNNNDWSMKVLLSSAKSKTELDNIIIEKERKAEAKKQAEQEKAKAEAKKQAEQKKQKPIVTMSPVKPAAQSEQKLDSRFYTRPPIINKNKSISNPSNLKYNKNPERLKTVTSSRFFMDGNQKFNKVPEDQDWYAWNYDTETMMPYGWRQVGTFPNKYVTSADSPFTLIHNDDGTWSVQETYDVKSTNGTIKTVTEYITIEYYIWCLTPPYYRKTMKQPTAN